MRPGLQGSEEITGRGREVTGSENFSFSPTVWRSHHTRRHPRVSFSYSLGFNIISSFLEFYSFLEFVQTFIMPHSQYNLVPIHSTIFLCTVASQPHINSVLSHKKAKNIHNTVLVMLENK